MHAICSRIKVILPLLYRGINLSPGNQTVKKFGMLTMSKRPFSLSEMSVRKTECLSQVPAGRQLLWRNNMCIQQIGNRALCDKTNNRAVDSDVKSGRLPDKEVQQVASSAQHEHFSARNPTNFDKRLLVYFGKYKTTEEVPDLVSVHALNSSRNKFRVYVNIFIAFLTMSGCVFMIYRGHTRAGQGETLADHNMRRHPQHYKQYQEKR